MRYSKFIYRLGGADYEVIQHNSSNIKTQYKNLAFSLLLSTVFAFIGGWDICHQFTTNKIFCFGVATLWATAVFSFDYFLINSGKVSAFSKYIRIPVGISNVLITITALFVLANQSTIDSNLRLLGSNEITKCDTTYQNEKQERNASLNAKKAEQELYHKERCLPEAKNGYPGKEYMKKHSLCITVDSLMAKEQEQLDSAEVAYHTTYTTTRDAIKGTTTNDFFRKAKELIPIFKDNYFTLFLAICALIFLSYIELQSILLKFNIDPNDEYHISLRDYNTNRKAAVATQMAVVATQQEKDTLLKNTKADNVLTQQMFEADIMTIDNLALMEMETKGKIQVFEEMGYDDTAKVLKAKWESYLKANTASANASTDLFILTQPMLNTIENIISQSTKEALEQNIFNWILENVQYDKEHNAEHYRTARECYNERKGLCGELSVLHIAFLRYAGIEALFAEVTKDAAGVEVKHGCPQVKGNDGSTYLSDIAYKSFKIEHQQYNVLSNEQLQAKYKNWNQ